MIPALFLATVIIWGTTWLAIALQVGPVPVLVSVFYRFATAGILFFLILLFSGRLKVPAKKCHIWLIAQALCLFSINFICFYSASSYIPSGLVSIIFSLATIFNAINARLFFGDKITKRVVLASLLGIAGLAFMFGRDILDEQTAGPLQGIALAGLGTLFFSLGNMVSRKNTSMGISPIIANAWGMGYGALILLAMIAITRTQIIAPPNLTYLGAMLYLAIFGSIIGFTTYLTLVAQIGSARAAYATVLFPIIALTLSTLFEGYVWHWTSLLGLIMALAGNVIIFAKPKQTPPTQATPPQTGQVAR